MFSIVVCVFDGGGGESSFHVFMSVKTELVAAAAADSIDLSLSVVHVVEVGVFILRLNHAFNCLSHQKFTTRIFTVFLCYPNGLTGLLYCSFLILT